MTTHPFAQPPQGASPTNVQGPWQNIFNQFNPVDNLQNRGVVAGNQGYSPAPGQPGYVQFPVQTGNQSHYQYQKPLTGVLGEQFNPNNQPSMGGIPLSALMQAMASDQQRLQQGANNQHGIMNQHIAGIQGAAGQGAGNILGTEAGNVGMLQPLMQMLSGVQTNQLPTWLNYTNPTLTNAQQVPGQVQQGIQQNVLPQIQKSGEQADSSLGQMAQTIQNYADMTAQEATQAADGIRRQARAALQGISAGTNPDGTQMTDAQRADLTQRVQYDTENQVAQANTQIFSRFNEVKAQMGQAMSQLMQSAAGIHLQGGQLGQQAGELQLGAEQLAAQAGIQLGAQMVDLLSGQRQVAQIATQLGQFIAQARSAAAMNAANLEVQGRTAAAQFAQANPESVVTLFDGLMSMYNLQNAALANRQAGGTAIL